MNSEQVSGFTIIKNGIILDFPFIESIKSLLPLCQEVVIAVGFDQPECETDDGTWALLETNFIDEKKVKLIKSYWNPASKKDGLILSEQTNIALSHCKNPLAFYLQADEALHEDDYQEIKENISLMSRDSKIEGIVFNYLHFYGNSSIIKKTRNTYRREVRLIRKIPTIQSIKDAQGFRHNNNKKLNCIQSKAFVYHYGWARPQEMMRKKIKRFDELYHGEQARDDSFSYQRIWGLRPFTGTHPYAMTPWVQKNKNDLDIMNLSLKHEWKNIGLAISDIIEYLTGHRLGEYKNFKLIK